MDELFQINQFLTRIQKNWNQMLFILGAYLILTVATGIMLHEVARFFKKSK